MLPSPIRDAPTPAALRIAGLAAVASGIAFLAGVALQTSTGWFPEEALARGDMGRWLLDVSAARTEALLGVGLSIVAIGLWMPFALVIHRVVAERSPALALLALSGYLTGIPLALAAFTLAFGATWGLVDAAAPGDAAISTALMRGFLSMDDLATFLIGGVGNGLVSVAALRGGGLPRWLGWLGVAAGLLVTVVLLRYVVPAFSLATIGYPLTLLWFVVAGIVLFRRGRRDEGLQVEDHP